MAESKQQMLDGNVHRRLLTFLNTARRPEDLMVAPPNEVTLIDQRVMHGNDENLHLDEVPHDHEHPHEITPLFKRDLARRLLKAREDISPLYGFGHIRQLDKIPGLDKHMLDRLVRLFSARFKGKWELLYDAD